MTAIEATARTAKTLADGTLRLTIEFEPAQAKQAFNLFCEQGTKLAVAALKAGYAVPEEVTNVTRPYGEQALKKEPLRFQGMRASHYAAMLLNEAAFWDFAGVLGSHEADMVLKEKCEIESKTELDRDVLALNRFAAYMQKYFAWTRKRIGQCDHEDEGLALANV